VRLRDHVPLRPALPAALVAAVALTGCGATVAGTESSGTPVDRPAAGNAAAPAPCGERARPLRRVVWIVMENHGYRQVVGARDAPYLNRLARACGLATNFQAETHPSLPNYIAMTSGSTQGVTDDVPPAEQSLDVPSIFSQLGRGWRALQESMPSTCARDDSGEYAVRHNPAVYYRNVQRACAAQNVPLRDPPAVSARFTFITPNLCDDMHDCSVGTGDRWLARWVPRILRTPAYRTGTMALFITWDEDDGNEGNRIATLVVSPGTRRGTRSATAFDHYSLLRTTEEILGLPLLGEAAGAASMRGAFRLR
jgi:phosphatidylinositol-3-phosphatase